MWSSARRFTPQGFAGSPLSRTGFPGHLQSFRGLWVGIDPSRPGPGRGRLHEPLEERHLGRAGAHTPDHELEQILAGRKSAQAGLDSAVKQGNVMLQQFARANQ